MGQTNHPEDFVDRLRALEREVAELRRGQTLAGAVISNGALEVRTDDGHIILKVGRFTYASQTVYGMALFRYDGSTQFWGWDTPAGGGYTSLWDEAGNILFSSDTVSGHGLASPFLPVPFVSASTAVPADTTTSGTFTDLQFAKYKPQHPRLYLFVLVRSSDGSTTGEVQVLVNGLALSAAQAVTAGLYGYLQFGPADLPGTYSHVGAVDVVVQARRTAGGGTIGARVVSAYGEGS